MVSLRTQFELNFLDRKLKLDAVVFKFAQIYLRNGEIYRLGLLLITNKKSHMGLWFVQKSMTSNDLEQCMWQWIKSNLLWAQRPADVSPTCYVYHEEAEGASITAADTCQVLKAIDGVLLVQPSCYYIIFSQSRTWLRANGNTQLCRTSRR